VEPTGQVSNRVSPSRSNLFPSFDFHSEAFGHWIKKKKDCFWIVAGNLGGFPAKATDEKNKGLRLYIEDLDADAIAMSETSRAWHLVSVGDKMPERTFGWYQALHIASSYYKSYEGSQATQYGGTTVWSRNTGTHRVMESGHDKLGIGRWTWTRYRGKQDHSLRVISAYRPVLNKSGTTSVWSQQRSFFDARNNDCCPRDIFVGDLVTEVQSWMESGDHIILGIDANEPIQSGWQGTPGASTVGILSSTHGTNTPATFTKGGSETIDDLFVLSPALVGCRCGLLPPMSCLDHRWFWIDIPNPLAFGSEVPPIVARRADRLRKDDPRTTKKFVELFKASLLAKNLIARADKLSATVHIQLLKSKPSMTRLISKPS
jgi:hypothetical protein